MKNILTTTALILCTFLSSATADDSTEKRVEISKMLRITGVEKMITEQKQQMLAEFKKQEPTNKDSSRFWVLVNHYLSVSNYLERVTPVYEKWFLLEDLKAINAFYESPAGVRLLAATPTTIKECTRIGTEWAENAINRATVESKAEQTTK